MHIVRLFLSLASLRRVVCNVWGSMNWVSLLVRRCLCNGFHCLFINQLLLLLASLLLLSLLLFFFAYHLF